MNDTEAADRTLVRSGSSFRLRPAEETLRIARAAMPTLGISRVTDITRMDRLGLPVYASVRPRAALLQVHAGKGLRPAEAEVGALMEAIEFAVAEPGHRSWACIERPVAAIATQLGDDLRFADLVPKWRLSIADDELVEAVACEDVGRGRAVLLPAELVFLPCEPRQGRALFGWTGNGLASGNSLDEATLHGLFEVLERDALAMSRIDNASRWVEPSSLPEPFAGLAVRWRALGIELVVRFVDNAFGLPCFEAFVHEPSSADIGLARGSGLHADRHIALSRAVCEAAQSRLSGIHGGREDLVGFYAKYRDKTPQARRAAERKVLDEVFDRARPIEWPSIPHGPAIGDDIGSVLDATVDRLRDRGFPAVFRHRFASAVDGLAVVKVVVPRCEEIEHDTERVGPRLLARIVENAKTRD